MPNMRSHRVHSSLFPLITRLLLAVLPLMLTTPAAAYGYADPGTGAFLYQAVYAVFLGGVFYLRKVLNRIWRKRK